MRKIIFASSFDEELLAIFSYVERNFGQRVADQIEARFRRIALSLAQLPRMGTQQHGYPTTLYAFAMNPSWVFYRFIDDTITFLHIRDGRMNKPYQLFPGAGK